MAFNYVGSSNWWQRGKRQRLPPHTHGNAWEIDVFPPPRSSMNCGYTALRQQIFSHQPHCDNYSINQGCAFLLLLLLFFYFKTVLFILFLCALKLPSLSELVCPGLLSECAALTFVWQAGWRDGAGSVFRAWWVTQSWDHVIHQTDCNNPFICPQRGVSQSFLTAQIYFRFFGANKLWNVI